jgi:hypothetical protein
VFASVFEAIIFHQHFMGLPFPFANHTGAGIACQITGTRWSGPAFFGTKGKK